MPGSWCSVPKCSSKGGHSFPVDELMRMKWLHAIRRKDWSPTPYSIVCREHFQPSDYLQNKNFQGRDRVRKMLKPGTVSSIFSWTGSDETEIIIKKKKKTRKCKKRWADAGKRCVEDNSSIDTSAAGQRQPKRHVMQSVFLLTLSKETQQFEKLVEVTPQGAANRATATNWPEVFIDCIDRESITVNECEVASEDADQDLTSSHAASGHSAFDQMVSRAVQCSDITQLSFITQPPHPDHGYCLQRISSLHVDQLEEEPKVRSWPQTRALQADEPEELHHLKASQDAEAPVTPSVHMTQLLDPVTRMTTCITMDLPDLPPLQSSGQSYRQPVVQSSRQSYRQPMLESSGQSYRPPVVQSSGQSYRQPEVQSSGQSYRQPVVQSSGPTSSESLGPHPHLPAPTPFPVLLIGPLGKQFLSQQFPMQAKSREEEVCQSSVQPHLSAGGEDLVEPPVVVKEELMDDSSDAQHCGEAVATQTLQESAAVAVVVKVEEAEGDSSLRCFQELEVTQGSTKCALVPVEVKMEAEDSTTSCPDDKKVHQTPTEFGMAVEVKVELVGDDDTQCFERREVHDTLQELAMLPIEVKMESVDDDDTRCFEETIIHHTPEECAMLPAEIKIEPLEDDVSTQRFDKREEHQTPDGFPMLAVKVKMEPVEGDGDSGCYKERYAPNTTRLCNAS